MANADIGLIGLGVMGSNLALNIAEKGHRIAVFNRTASRTDEFVAKAGEFRDRIVGCHTIADLAAAIRPPRPIIVMVQAGKPVDEQIALLKPVLAERDIIIDAGNANFHDTVRRFSELAGTGLTFIGMGVSGGEEGARHGPSIMVGGTRESYARVEQILTAISAKYNGEPCCAWLGEGGAGHFVKTIHNGIEYADMQMIAEVYGMLRDGLGMSPSAMADIFATWNKGRLNSYLIEITADILTRTEGDVPLVDQILDAAGQKGTGKWTVIASLDLGQPTALVGEAVYARIVSSEPERRRRASDLFDQPVGAVEVTTNQIEQALYASKIVSYAQGFRLMAAASEEHGWDLDLGTIASIWRAGCIIRADFLEDITGAYRANEGLEDMMEADFFVDALGSANQAWRATVAAATSAGVPVPAYSSALAYFDSMRSERLPANLIQAQRDYFGAHTFERVDRPRGEFFHHEWEEG